jgi:acetyl-CoA carboxylase biotin carboxyl carrier protein
VPLLEIRCEVAGRIARVAVEVGAAVRAEDTLLVIESMKMEIPVPAPVAGVVEAILVGEGDEVAEGQHAATLRP